LMHLFGHGHHHHHQASTKGEVSHDQ
jgi:hypothetical protein